MEPIKTLDISEIKTLTLERLKKPATLIAIDKLILHLAEVRESNIALNLIRKLEDLLGRSEENSQVDIFLYRDYEAKIVFLKFIALPYLKEKEIEELFRNKFLFALKRDFDLKRQIEYYILYFSDAGIGVKFSNLVMMAIGNNEEQLGDKPLRIQGEEKPLLPSLRNWLRSYNQFFKPREIRSALEEGEYLSRDENVRELEEKDKKILEKVIKIYDFLRFPNVGLEELPEVAEEEMVLPKSKTLLPAVPLEESGDSREKQKVFPQKILERPVKTALDKSIKTPQEISTKDLVNSSYLGDSQEEKMIIEEIENFRKETQRDYVKISQKFAEILNLPQDQRTKKIKILALLSLLAQSQKIGDLLKDQRFSGLIKDYLKNKNKENLLADFDQNPTSWQFFKILLQYILQEKLGLSEHEASRWGIRLGNETHDKQYKRLAYFDLKEKIFRWL